MATPIAIAQDTELTRSLNELKTLRGEFATAVSKMYSGAFSIKRAFSGLADDIIAKCDVITSRIEILSVPVADFSDFEAGTKTLSEFTDFDVIAYYNQIKKLKFGMFGILVALIGLQENNQQPLRQSVPYQSQGQSIDILSDDEFLGQGFEQPVFEVEYDIRNYTIIQGDTLQGIAVKTLKDAARWPEIARINNITDNNLIDDPLLVGTSIKIPVTRKSFNRRSSRNLVYEATYGTTQEEINKFFFGGDIFLRTDSGVSERLGRMEADKTGDLRIVEGVECVIGNIQDRLAIVKRNLNPLHPEYGVRPINDKSQAPYIIALERLLKDMEQQTSDDPRVKQARLPRNKVTVKGDALEAELNVSLISGTPIQRKQIIPT